LPGRAGSAHGFVQSAALGLAAYVIGGFPSYMFRELRHLLFVVVLVAPLVATELERASRKPPGA
jgi:hypothetical protein